MTTRTMPTPVEWNDHAILAAAGGNPDAVIALLKSEGQPLPTQMAVYQWWSRKMLPNKWRSKVIYALLRTKKISINDLFALKPSRRKPSPPSPQPIIKVKY